jgi:ribose/xylose/arabinose/galactoside ABC-type transport system permease subunit
VSVQNAPAAAPPAPRSGIDATRLVERLLRVRELSLVGVLAVIVLATTLYNERFVNSQNLRDISLNVAIVAMLAVGQTIVVVSRNIDLSVGSVLGFTALAVGSLFADNPGIPIPLVVVIGIAMGAGFGAINGALVSVGRVPSLVVTIGTLYIIRGADFAWASGRQVTASQLPDDFLRIGSNSIAGIPILPLITLVVVIVAGFAMRSYRSGRELYAIGSNPEAAVLAGLPVGRRVFWAFVVSGALAGLAGVMYTARFGTRRGRRRRGRRRGDLRRRRHRLWRGAGRPAALGHRIGAGDPEDQPVLGARHRRRPAARSDRARSPADAARRQRPAEEECSPCPLMCAPAWGAGRRSPSRCWSSRSSPARSRRPTS